MLTVASWNMHKGPASWENIRSLMSVHGVSVALVQEARQPRLLPDGWQTNPPAEEHVRWRAVPRYRLDDRDGSRKETNRWWASAVVSSGVRRVTSRDPVELHLAADGEFPCSHPGQFAVSDVALTDGRRLTVVSLYGIWDLVGGSRDKYVEATLHRAISDLTCRHVNTYLNGSNPRNRPYQLDYFLATPQLREYLTGCWADPDPNWFIHRDHRAIFASFDL